MLFYLIAFLFVVGFGALAYSSPRYALTLLAAILPTYGVRFSLAGVPFTALEAAIWGTAIGWFAREWREHGAPPLRRMHAMHSSDNPFTPYLWPMLLWLMVSAAAASYSPDVMSALGIWKAYFVEPLMVFVMVVLTFRHRDDRWCLVWALGGTVAAMGAFAWYQHFTGLALPQPWATNRPLRVTSWYSYPNAVGLFIGPVLPMYFVWLLNDLRNWRGRIVPLVLKVIVFVLGLGAIIFAVSKGAWIGVAAGCFVGALLLFKKQWKLVLGIGVVIAAVVFVVTPLRNHVLDEFLFQSPSGKIRLVVWQETIALLKDHPIAGAGLAGYQTALVPYHNPWHKDVSPYALEIFLYPHNVFLNFWVELGLGGLLTFLWLMIAFFHEAWKRRDRLLSMMAMAAMVALLVHGLVDVPYFKNDLAVLFWLIMSLPLLETTEEPIIQ